MKKTHNQIIFIFSILLMVLNTPVFAQMSHMKEHGQSGHSQHDEMSHGKAKHHASCWMESLSDEQKAKIAKLRLEYKKVKSLKKAEIRVKKLELATMVAHDPPDQDAINKKIDEILDLKREKMQKKYAFKIAMRSLLTPEQQVSFDMHMLKKALHGKGHGQKKGHGYR